MSKVKFCFIMIVYNSDYVLGECLRSALPFGPMLVTEGPCGYWAEHPMKADNTMDILEAHKDYGQGILQIKRGVWTEKDQMSNALMDKVPMGTTHVFVVDADEVWRERDLKYIEQMISLKDYDSMDFVADSFFGGFDHILTGFERDFPVTRIQRWYPGAVWKTHRPPTIEVLRGSRTTMKDLIHASVKDTLSAHITMPHYSYVFPSQAEMKHIYYSHYQPGITIPDYVERVFLPWMRGNDAEKQAIESIWDGVHNFIPTYRKSCRTMPFNGEHPEEIQKSMPELRKRLQQELDARA